MGRLVPPSSLLRLRATRPTLFTPVAAPQAPLSVRLAATRPLALRLAVNDVL